MNSIGDTLNRLLLIEPPNQTGNPLTLVLDCASKLEAILLVPAVALLIGFGNLQLAKFLLEGASLRYFLIGSGELILGSILLWTTVTRWAQWVPGIMRLGALRAFISLWTGTIPGYHPTPVPRIETAFFIVYAVAAGALSWRYSWRRPKEFEKVSLMVFIISTFPILFLDRYPTFVLVSVTFGVAVLGLARLKRVRR